MAASTAPEEGGAPLRVLVPYIATYGGGVRTVLGAGLPRLAAQPGLEVVYAELCCNEADMAELERAGVPVDREAGVPGPGTFRGPGGGRLAGAWRQVRRLSRMARRLSERLGGYDVCYCHGHRELLLAIAARALARTGPRPAIVWHWHAPPLSTAAGRRGSWAGRRVVGLCWRSCERVIAISKFCARQAASMGVDDARVVTVLNAASVHLNGAAASATAPVVPERPPGAFVSFLPCASIRRHKGVHVAVEAMRHLPSNHVLWISGERGDPVASDYASELENTALRIGAADRVHFVGARRDVHRVMARADVVVVPSTWEEPFGLVAAEAQLLGVPVVASRRGALPEIVADGEHGLVFDPGDPAALAAAIVRLEGDGEGRARMAEAARAHATKRYSYDRWAREVAAVLRAARPPAPYSPHASWRRRWA